MTRPGRDADRVSTFISPNDATEMGNKLVFAHKIRFGTRMLKFSRFIKFPDSLAPPPVAFDPQMRLRRLRRVGFSLYNSLAPR